MHGEVADWNTADHLLATIADLLALSNWQRSAISAAQAKKPRPALPQPLPRPGGRKEHAPEITAAQLRDWKRRHAAALDEAKPREE